MRGESQAAQKHHDQDSRQPPDVVETLSEGIEMRMNELCRVFSSPPIHWRKGSAVFQLCPRRSWLRTNLVDAAVRQRNTTHACEIALWHHISDLRKVQEVDTIPRTTTVGVENTYLRLLAGPPCAVKCRRDRSSRAEAYHEGQRRRNRRRPPRVVRDNSTLPLPDPR